MSKAKAVAKKKKEKKEAKPAAQVCMVMPGNDLMTITNLLGVIVEDARFEFFPNGMRSVCVDASHCAMIALTYGEFYENDVPEHTLALELGRLHDVLKKGLGKAKGRGEKRKSDYTLNFEWDKNTFMYGISDVDGEWKASYRGLDPSTVNSPNIPTVAFTTSFEMPATKLAEKLEFCKLVGDLVTIEVDNDVVIKTAWYSGVNGNGPLLAGHESPGGSSSVDNSTERKVKSQYSLTYLLPLVKVLKGQNLKVSTGESYPLMIECDLDLGYETKPLKFTYFLAPRVESDY